MTPRRQYRRALTDRLLIGTKQRSRACRQQTWSYPQKASFTKLIVFLGIQIRLLADRGEERIFRRDCCPVSSPSEPPRPAKERGDDVSSPLSLESLPSSRH